MQTVPSNLLLLADAYNNISQLVHVIKEFIFAYALYRKGWMIKIGLFFIL